MDERSVEFFFDFISPYSWLALESAPGWAREHGARFELRPVVYTGLLAASGRLGPAESGESQRRYTFVDVERAARRLGRVFRGPPRHPFRSIELLRALTVWRDESSALELALEISRRIWERGEDPETLPILERALATVGIEAGDLEARIGAPEVKEALRAETDRAIAKGVFGVPTWLFDGELFWGHDRLPALGDRVLGRSGPASREVRDWLERPLGPMRGSAKKGKLPPI